MALLRFLGCTGNAYDPAMSVSDVFVANMVAHCEAAVEPRDPFRRGEDG